MKTLLLIDANALIHRSFHALPPLTTPVGEPIQAIYGLVKILLKLFRDESPAEGFEYVAALFDRPEPTFRKEKYIEYKAHRPKAPDELISQIIKAHEVFDKFGVRTYEIPGYEADDLIGTAAERFKKEAKVVILTGDMDALQLVEGERVVVKTFQKGIGETSVYNEAKVEERYGLAPRQLPDYKALSGDPSDNIPGIQGVGPKTATALLKEFGSIAGIYRSITKDNKWYEKIKNREKDAHLFLELATIRKDAPLEMKDLEELAKKPLDTEMLDAYFVGLGFKSLLVPTALPAPRAKEKKEKPKKDKEGQLSFL